MILLPRPPQYWKYGQAPLCPAFGFFFYFVFCESIIVAQADFEFLILRLCLLSTGWFFFLSQSVLPYASH